MPGIYQNNLLEWVWDIAHESVIQWNLNLLQYCVEGLHSSSEQLVGNRSTELRCLLILLEPTPKVATYTPISDLFNKIVLWCWWDMDVKQCPWKPGFLRLSTLSALPRTHLSSPKHVTNPCAHLVLPSTGQGAPAAFFSLTRRCRDGTGIFTSMLQSCQWYCSQVERDGQERGNTLYQGIV